MAATGKDFCRGQGTTFSSLLSPSILLKQGLSNGFCCASHSRPDDSQALETFYLCLPTYPTMDCGIKDVHLHGCPSKGSSGAGIHVLRFAQQLLTHLCSAIFWGGHLIYRPGLTQTQEQSSCLGILDTGIIDMSHDTCLKSLILMVLSGTWSVDSSTACG